MEPRVESHLLSAFVDEALEHRAPLDVLAQDAKAVWQAARLDRFVACG